MRNPFGALTKFERVLWLISLGVIVAAFVAVGGDTPTLIASLVGVTALIFVSKGDVFGQILIVVFSVVYAVISFSLQYYGEMITYLGMSAPIALASVVTWLRNPFKAAEVKVNRLPMWEWGLLAALTAGVTFAFYFVLAYFNTANLPVSTVSIATSFLASYLMMRRSPYYALAYGANDVVLIVLWGMAAWAQPSLLPMVVCFVMFLLNDLYGLFNWSRMRERQAQALRQAE